MSSLNRRASFLSLSISLAVLAPCAFAQETPDVPAIENSKFQASGSINANSVFVRSGPGDGEYPVMKLDKGATLRVVGKRFDWLKVVPPDGSFCYVAKAYVDRHGDGTNGRVTRELYVRVGSQLNDMKSKIATKLEAGRDVTIIGEQNEYFKIKPPEDVFFFVNVQYMDVAKVIDPQKANGKATEELADNSKEAKPSEPPTIMDSKSDGSKGESPVAMDPKIDSTNPPTTEPSVATNTATNGASNGDAETSFDKLEVAYGDMTQKPLEQQDIAGLLAGYTKMAKGDSGLPESLRRVAESKAEFLKGRLKDREEYLAVKKQQDEMKQKQTALQAERGELEERIKASDIKYYSAVGVLRPSSLQTGPVTLYRLTDPANGRTVIYLKSEDQKLAGLMGQFVGVKGDAVDDTQLSLKVISPTLFETCDQTKLNDKISAQIMPPSLMPGSTASSTSGNE